MQKKEDDGEEEEEDEEEEEEEEEETMKRKGWVQRIDHARADCGMLSHLLVDDQILVFFFFGVCVCVCVVFFSLPFFLSFPSLFLSRRTPPPHTHTHTKKKKFKKKEEKRTRKWEAGRGMGGVCFFLNGGGERVISVRDGRREGGTRRSPRTRRPEKERKKERKKEKERKEKKKTPTIAGPQECSD